MALTDDVRKCVFFIGHGSEETFASCGTAFLLHHDGSIYLVTAGHVAHGVGDDPFSLRINRLDGTSTTFHVDPHSEDHPEWFKWFFPEDQTIDLAIIPFNVNAHTAELDVRALIGNDWILDEAKRLEEKIGLGDVCYAVGLFSLVQGARRNVPIIHTGHVALLAGEEPIDVGDWVHDGRRILIDAHLVEMANLRGLSGAPVFVRGEYEIEFGDGHQNVLAQDTRLHLLGVWHGSWEHEMPNAKRGERVPLGMGIVVPASQLLALLEQPDVVAERARFNAAHAQAKAPVADTNG